MKMIKSKSEIFIYPNFKKNSDKRGQIGIEYMIIIGFVTFAVMAILVIAMFYSDKIKDKIKINQVENFATQLLNSAESVFFAGEPSKSSRSLYLPEGVRSITINGNEMVILIKTSSGDNTLLYISEVPLSGTVSNITGTKQLTLTAQTNSLLIVEG